MALRISDDSEKLIAGFDNSDDSARLADIGGSFGHDIRKFPPRSSHPPGRLIFLDRDVIQGPVKPASKLGYNENVINTGVSGNTGYQWDAYSLRREMRTQQNWRETTRRGWEKHLDVAGVESC
ncbi:hypothetical protein CEK25_002889 [Fusarium fujikuroi]|nr:hypothetical protein CEK25_002889 [Fusarium fujikuroi]